jgi:hypothetical protein
MRVVQLPSSSALAIDISADSAPEHVFTSPGTYRFAVSDNLETEDEVTRPSVHRPLSCRRLK